jgi:RNA polymerase sigma factor (sigma-70 family)
MTAVLASVLTDDEVRKITNVVTHETLARFPGLSRDLDDIRSDAMLGIARAIAKHNPDTGVPLAAYAYLRARGEVLDGLRARSPVRRAAHARGRTLLDLAPHELPPRSIQQDELTIRDDRAEAAYDAVDARLTCPELLSLLTPNQQATLIGYYLLDRRLPDIAADLGICERRAYQLLDEGLTVLRGLAA